jgi:hypothetical protein
LIFSFFPAEEEGVHRTDEGKLGMLLSGARCPLALTLSPGGGEGIARWLVSFIVDIVRARMVSRAPRGETTREDGDGNLRKGQAHGRNSETIDIFSSEQFNSLAAIKRSFDVIDSQLC